MRFKEEVLTRRDIETRLARVGDYVKMDFLQQCLKKGLDFETRRFALTTLAKIYEGRSMYLEAGKLIRIAADINTTFDAKMQDFLKSAELYIKAGSYEESDISMTKAFAVANERQKVEIKVKIKESYKKQAQDFLKKDKRKHAAEAYEKLLTLDLNPLEKKEVQKTLLELYQKLGKIRDFYALQKSIESPGIQQSRQQNSREIKEKTSYSNNDVFSDLGI